MIGRSGYVRQPSEDHFSSVNRPIDERRLQVRPGCADTRNVKLRRISTDDRIARAFAEAVSDGNLEAAEGWLAVAALRANRSEDRRHAATPKLTDRRILR